MKRKSITCRKDGWYAVDLDSADIIDFNEKEYKLIINDAQLSDDEKLDKIKELVASMCNEYISKVYKIIAANEIPVVLYLDPVTKYDVEIREYYSILHPPQWLPEDYFHD